MTERQRDKRAERQADRLTDTATEMRAVVAVQKQVDNYL